MIKFWQHVEGTSQISFGLVATVKYYVVGQNPIYTHEPLIDEETYGFCSWDDL